MDVILLKSPPGQRNLWPACARSFHSLVDSIVSALPVNALDTLIARLDFRMKSEESLGPARTCMMGILVKHCHDRGCNDVKVLRKVERVVQDSMIDRLKTLMDERKTEDEKSRLDACKVEIFNTLAKSPVTHSMTFTRIYTRRHSKADVTQGMSCGLYVPPRYIKAGAQHQPSYR